MFIVLKKSPDLITAQLPQQYQMRFQMAKGSDKTICALFEIFNKQATLFNAFVGNIYPIYSFATHKNATTLAVVVQWSLLYEILIVVTFQR